MIKCEECGKEFVKKAHNQRFCSKLCKQRKYRMLHRNKYKNKCIMCGMKVPLGRIKFCSDRCKKRYQYIKTQATIKTKYSGSKSGKWDENDVNKLIKNYYKYTSYELVSILDRNIASIQSKINSLIKKGVLISKKKSHKINMVAKRENKKQREKI